MIQNLIVKVFFSGLSLHNLQLKKPLTCIRGRDDEICDHVPCLFTATNFLQQIPKAQRAASTFQNWSFGGSRFSLLLLARKLSELCCNEWGSDLNNQTLYFGQQQFMSIKLPRTFLTASWKRCDVHPIKWTPMWLPMAWLTLQLSLTKAKNFPINFPNSSSEMIEIDYVWRHLVSFWFQVARAPNKRSQIVSCHSLGGVGDVVGFWSCLRIDY